MQLLWLFISTFLQVFCVLRSYVSVFRISSYNASFYFKRTCKMWSSCEIYIYLEQCCLFPWIQYCHCSTGSQGLISVAYTWKWVCKWEVFNPFSPKRFGRTCVRAKGLFLCRPVTEQWASVTFLLNATFVVFLTGSRSLVHACFWRKMTCRWIKVVGWCYITYLPARLVGKQAELLAGDTSWHFCKMLFCWGLF